MYFLFNRYLSYKTVFIWLSEFVLILATAVLAAAVRLKIDYEPITLFAYDPWFVKTVIVALVYLVVIYLFELYSPEYYYPGRQMFMRLLQATAVATVVLFSLYYILPPLKTWRGMLLLYTVLLPLLIYTWRVLFTKANHLGFELPEKRVLIMGTGELARKIGHSIYHMTDNGLNLVGFIDDDPERHGESIVNPGVIGGYGDIAKIVDEYKVDRIIVALADRRAKLPMSALLDCKLKGVSIDEGETFSERMTGTIPVNQLKPSWMVFSDGFKSLRTRKIMKRVFDVLSASLIFLIALPIMIITVILIKLESRGPIIFRQVRVGENGREFEIYKFRSMRADAESGTGPVWADTNDTRVTRVGAVIRLLRIDELPQLINILKGDMSFVGPRPERPFFVEKLKEVIPYYEVRTVVKPGLTGWAQIKYPYGASVEDAHKKLEYDIYYIKNMTPLLDLIIFLMTVRTVISGRGAR